MSVFTCVSESQVSEFLGRFSIGSLQSLQGIAEGVENTNYFLTTTSGEFVLTIFERVPHEDIPFCLDFTAYLSEHGVPAPHPVADHDNRYLSELAGKPAAIIKKLNGRSVREPTGRHCELVAGVLADMHQAGLYFPSFRANPRGLDWATEHGNALKGHIPESEQAVIDDELGQLRDLNRDALPTGAVHLDLFTDNVLFEHDHLGGLIDFYYACTELLVYDLAITVNEWCKSGGGLDTDRVGAFMDAYLARRPLKPAEKAAWPLMLRQAALRFWLSRLYDKYFPRDGEMVQIKDPDVFRDLLLYHRENARVLN